MPERPITELEKMVGDSYITVDDMKIEKGKIQEFARATRLDNPIYFSEESAKEQGYDTIPAPPTFLRTAMFPRHRPNGEDIGFAGEGMFDLGFNPAYRIHGEESFEYGRVLYDGEVLTAITTLADIYQKEGARGGTMTFAVLETRFKDEAGSDVVTERTTLIEPESGITEEGQHS